VEVDVAHQLPFGQTLSMNFNALVPELWGRYPFLNDDRLPVRLGIREPDVEQWAASFGGDRGQLYDAFARYLAIAFHQRKLPFAFCDSVMNDLEAVISYADDVRPDLFWSVYLAFDAGEYHRRADKSDDPVAEHTEPAIADIVRGL
jgi:hypothetical protein